MTNVEMLKKCYGSSFSWEIVCHKEHCLKNNNCTAKHTLAVCLIYLKLFSSVLLQSDAWYSVHPPTTSLSSSSNLHLFHERAAGEFYSDDLYTTPLSLLRADGEGSGHQ
jgi:hypothetical protein